MKDKKSGVFKRKQYPNPKEGTIKDFADAQQLKILKKLLKQGAAFIVIGSENSPRAELMAALRFEMRTPVYSGVVAYDANVPYKTPFDRDVVTISINDWGNKNYIHSIKKLGAERSRTLYAAEVSFDGQ